MMERMETHKHSLGLRRESDGLTALEDIAIDILLFPGPVCHETLQVWVEPTLSTHQITHELHTLRGEEYTLILVRKGNRKGRNRALSSLCGSMAQAMVGLCYGDGPCLACFPPLPYHY